MQIVFAKPALALAVLSCLAGLASAAVPSGPDARTLSAIAPAQRAAFIANWHARALRARASTPDGKIDKTPPVLTGFSLSATADASVSGAQILASVSATDNLSGVAGVSLSLVGPSGQTLYISLPQGLPVKSYSSQGALDLTLYTEPGVWTVGSLAIWDNQGNEANFDASTLAGSSVTVANQLGSSADITPPTLTGGKVLTPTVSLSVLPKGTTAAQPNAGAAFAVADTGSTKASGVDDLTTIWCLADQSACFFMLGNEPVRGQSRATMDVVTPFSLASATPGAYVLDSVQIEDHAGNFTFLTSTDFGGATDFDKLMPGGHTIVVTP